MNPNTPHRKVVAGGLAGALSAIAIWTLQQLTGISIPAEIAVAINTLFVFGVQYYVPNQAEVSDA